MEKRIIKLDEYSNEDAIEAGDIDQLDFTTDMPQVIYPRGLTEIVRFAGPCARDQRRTYSLTGRGGLPAYSDPSAVLGSHYAVIISPEHLSTDLVGPDVSVCWECYNNSGSDVCAEAVAAAAAKWSPRPPQIVVGGTEFRVTPVEPFWDAERDAGGDGYDQMERATKERWSPLSGWGRDGWDFLEWPYYVGYVRNTPEGFEFATNCEGDIDMYRFPTREARENHLNRLAFWHWQSKGEDWVKYVHPDKIPDRLKGPFSWERSEREKGLD